MPLSSLCTVCVPDKTGVTSSFRIVPVALVVVIVAPVAFDNVTVKPSSDSTVVSPATLTVMVWLVSPAAKFTVPEGSVPPVKSAALGSDPLLVTAQVALLAAVVEPARVTVKVNGVVPEFPSGRLAFVAAIDRVETFVSRVPAAEAVPKPMLPGDTPLGTPRVTVKSAFCARPVFPATLMLMVFDSSPVLNVTIPAGSTPPTNELAVAAFAPVPAAE